MIGKCLCGEVVFAMEARGVGLYQCHCSQCRRQGGSASNTATIVPSAAFLWIRGEAGISSYTRATGFRSDFCARCGSPVPNRLRETEYVWVPAGLLENGAEMRIVAHLHVESKARWDVLPGVGERYDGSPPLGELLALLHVGAP